MPPPDRTRAPSDVARRLAALSAPRRDAAPVAQEHALREHVRREHAPQEHASSERGSYPQGPHAPDGPAPAHGDPGSAVARAVPGTEPARRGWTPPTPARDAGGAVAGRTGRDVAAGGDRTPPDPDPAVGPRAPVEPVDASTGGEPPWRPTVTAALTAAAAAAGTPAASEVRRPAVRWAPDPRTAGAAVLVLALVAGGLVLRTGLAPRGEAVAVPTPAVPGTTSPAAPASSAQPAGAQDTVVVHVVGAVAQPGVVHLPLGSRVSEAVAACGGSLPAADLAGVNLARVLTDGEQLVVPVVGAAPAPAAPAPQEGLVDLTTADAATLEELPGVGPVLARRIVEHREAHPFTSVDELDDVTGIGPALLADLRTRVRV